MSAAAESQRRTQPSQKAVDVSSNRLASENPRC